MENSMLTIGYAIYLPIAIFLTLFVAKSLFKNARVFMLDIFHQKEDIALATNKLFEIGFYLMNIGFALLILKFNDVYNPIDSSQELIERLAVKIGGFSIYLGIMLFLNLFMFFRGRKKSKISEKKIEFYQSLD
jgi:H+/gluconate symporter-like permease